MAGERPQPAGLDTTPQWDTIHSDRTVLLIARTLTSAVRLLDVLDVFRGDFRVRPVFAVDEGTHSGAGVRDLLHSAGIHQIVPWTALPEQIHYDLALSASEQLDPDTITGTTLVLPHGVGFNKYVPNADGPGRRLAGLPPTAALRTGLVRLVLSHPDQHAQLVAANPDIAGQTVVTGDPTFERLRASRPLRERYRHALDADGRTVVLLSSTWGAESAFGRWRDLPRRLLADLPADEYVVCLALHPNIWARHGPAVLRTWLADCLDAGLCLLPPERGWQAALVAADLVIGDHGSITLLAAGLGKPVLLAAFGPDTEVVPDTPVADLGRAATRLDAAAPLRDQLDKAIATHDPRRFAPITTRTFAHVGDATARLRELIYRELDLAPLPADPVLRRFPDPRAEEHRAATAFDVYATVVPPAQVVLLRHPRPVHDPTALDRPVGPPGEQFVRHLAVDESCGDLRLAQTASVLGRRRVAGAEQARDWAQRALLDYPGARVAAAATADGCVVEARGRGQFVIRTDSAARPTDALLLGSALYSCLLAGQLAPGPLTVHTGTHTAAGELDAR